MGVPVYSKDQYLATSEIKKNFLIFENHTHNFDYAWNVMIC